MLINISLCFHCVGFVQLSTSLNMPHCGLKLPYREVKARYSVLVGRLAFALPATVNERNFRRGFDIYLSFPTSRVLRGSHTKYRFDIYNCFLINGHYNGKIKPVSILLPFKHTPELKIEFLHQLVSVKIYVSCINLY